MRNTTRALRRLLLYPIEAFPMANTREIVHEIVKTQSLNGTNVPALFFTILNILSKTYLSREYLLRKSLVI